MSIPKRLSIFRNLFLAMILTLLLPNARGQSTFQNDTNSQARGNEETLSGAEESLKLFPTDALNNQYANVLMPMVESDLASVPEPFAYSLCIIGASVCLLLRGHQCKVNRKVSGGEVHRLRLSDD
jgi:hypothetical protein